MIQFIESRTDGPVTLFLISDWIPWHWPRWTPALKILLHWGRGRRTASHGSPAEDRRRSPGRWRTHTPAPHTWHTHRERVTLLIKHTRVSSRSCFTSAWGVQPHASRSWPRSGLLRGRRPWPRGSHTPGGPAALGDPQQVHHGGCSSTRETAWASPTRDKTTSASAPETRASHIQLLMDKAVTPILMHREKNTVKIKSYGHSKLTAIIGASFTRKCYFGFSSHVLDRVACRLSVNLTKKTVKH